MTRAEGCGTGCIRGAGANAGPGCSLTDLGAICTGPWSCAVGLARGAGITGVAVGCSIGCGPGGGTVETRMTCCITCGGGIGGCSTGAGVGNWVDSDSWEVDGSMSACLACTGCGKSRKGFDLSEGAGEGAGVLLLESIEERSLAISRSCSALVTRCCLSSHLVSASLALSASSWSRCASLACSSSGLHSKSAQSLMLNRRICWLRWQIMDYYSG